MVREVFGLDSRVIVDPTSGKPLMLPIGRHHMHDDDCRPADGTTSNHRSIGTTG
jgi:iron complex transport system ATP-binding protein